MRREETKTAKVIMKMNVDGKIGRGKPKKRSLDMIENDMRAVADFCCVCIRDVENRDKWRFWTRVVDPK
jgi:hypothetical protein